MVSTGPDTGGQVGVGIADGQLLSCEQQVFVVVVNMSNKTSFDKVYNARDIHVYKQIQTEQIQRRHLQIDTNTGNV